MAECKKIFWERDAIVIPIDVTGMEVGDTKEVACNATFIEKYKNTKIFVFAFTDGDNTFYIDDYTISKQLPFPQVNIGNMFLLNDTDLYKLSDGGSSISTLQDIYDKYGAEGFVLSEEAQTDFLDGVGMETPVVVRGTGENSIESVDSTGATGINTVALGKNAKAIAQNGIAIGTEVEARNTQAVFGHYSGEIGNSRQGVFFGIGDPSNKAYVGFLNSTGSFVLKLKGTNAAYSGTISARLLKGLEKSGARCSLNFTALSAISFYEYIANNTIIDASTWIFHLEAENIYNNCYTDKPQLTTVNSDTAIMVFSAEKTANSMTNANIRNIACYAIDSNGNREDFVGAIDETNKKIIWYRVNLLSSGSAPIY